MIKHFCDFCSKEIFRPGQYKLDGKDIVDKNSPNLLCETGWLFRTLRDSDRLPNTILCNSCYQAGMKPINEFLDRIERCAAKT